jgi:hypothetical protein
MLADAARGSVPPDFVGTFDAACAPRSSEPVGTKNVPTTVTPTACRTKNRVWVGEEPKPLKTLTGPVEALFPISRGVGITPSSHCTDLLGLLRPLPKTGVARRAPSFGYPCWLFLWLRTSPEVRTSE